MLRLGLGITEVFTRKTNYQVHLELMWRYTSKKMTKQISLCIVFIFGETVSDML